MPAAAATAVSELAVLGRSSAADTRGEPGSRAPSNVELRWAFFLIEGGLPGDDAPSDKNVEEDESPGVKKLRLLFRFLFSAIVGEASATEPQAAGEAPGVRIRNASAYVLHKNKQREMTNGQVTFDRDEGTGCRQLECIQAQAAQ